MSLSKWLMYTVQPNVSCQPIENPELILSGLLTMHLVAKTLEELVDVLSTLNLLNSDILLWKY